MTLAAALILALPVCFLVGSPTVEAAHPGAKPCASAKQVKKTARAKGRKVNKHRARTACPPSAVASVPAATSTSAPAPPSPATGGSTSSTPAADACGARIAKSTGGYWDCSFSDDFDGGGLDSSKWVAQRTAASGFGDGTSCFVDSPNNIAVSNGTLKLTSRQETSPFTCNDPYGNFTTQYTSGMVSTWGGRFSQTYGRFEVRARLSPAQVKGLQTSLWLWPVDAGHYGAYPASGEIDFAEMYSAYPDRAIPYIHYNPAATDPNVTNTSCMISDLGAFHDYVVEWTPSSIKIIYDGRTCLTDYWDPASPLTRPQPFDQPFLIALTQGLGSGGNAFDPATTPLPATTEVDYVRAWK